VDRPATRAYLRRARSRSRDDIAQPGLIANGDNDRMVATAALAEDIHRRIAGSELTIYPDSGHGAIFQYHAEFASTAIEFIDH
jgi:pimeloyl-ACP methyl ester carboxylesterase